MCDFFVLLRPTHRIWLSLYTLTSGLFGNRTHYITAFPLNMHFIFLSFVSFIGSLWWSFVKLIVEIIIQISSHIFLSVVIHGAPLRSYEVKRGEAVLTGAFSCEVPSGLTGRSSGRSGGTWRAWHPCVSWSGGWARRSGRTSTRSPPRSTGTASHLSQAERLIS